MPINNSIINQKGTPAFFSDTFANRPTYGYTGRVFISTDTGAIYEDTGTSWTLIADAGAGTTGTLQQVTTNGNTTNTGITISAGGLITNAARVSGLTQSGGVLFTDGSGNLGQDINFNWDITNNYLGIGQTGTPTAPLDIHSATDNVFMQVNATSTNNSTIAFQNASVGKWRIGNLYSGGSNLFHIYNNTTASNLLSVTAANAATFIGSVTALSLAITGGTSGQFLKANGTVDSTAYISLTSLSATTPLSYNSGTGAFSITQSSGSTNGYLSSTDWTTFNSKQSALTNPVTGTGTLNTIVKFTATGTTVGNSNISDSGSLITLGSSTLITGSTTASSAIARGTYLTPTLIASANSDVLVGLDINPTYNVGAFTGVFQYGLRIIPRQTAQIALGGINQSGLIIFARGSDGSFQGSIGYTSTTSLFDFQISSGGSSGVIGFFTASTKAANFFPTGNFLLQNGGTFTDAGFRLDVVGTTRISGVLTLSSTISNGTYTYTLPSNTGTLALTSALSSYLPLTGGTLTGALSGTSATFSSNVGIGTTYTNTLLNVNVPASSTDGLSLIDSTSVPAVFTYSSATGENRIGGLLSYVFPTFYAGGSERYRITSAGIHNYTSRGNYNGSTDNSLFSLNSGGTLYTTGFSPNATANSTNTLTLTTAQTTWIYNGTGVATWTLFNPSGTNQMIWIKNAGTGIITLNAYSGTNIINNSGTAVSSITIAVGATVLIQQDGNVKSYQLQ